MFDPDSRLATGLWWSHLILLTYLSYLSGFSSMDGWVDPYEPWGARAFFTFFPSPTDTSSLWMTRLDFRWHIHAFRVRQCALMFLSPWALKFFSCGRSCGSLHSNSITHSPIYTASQLWGSFWYTGPDSTRFRERRAKVRRAPSVPTFSAIPCPWELSKPCTPSLPPPFTHALVPFARNRIIAPRSHSYFPCHTLFPHLLCRHTSRQSFNIFWAVLPCPATSADSPTGLRAECDKFTWIGRFHGFFTPFSMNDSCAPLLLPSYVFDC